MVKLHETELAGAGYRMAVAGGWIYSSPSGVVFVPSPRSPHVRDLRRIRLRDGWEFTDFSATTSWFETGVGSWENCVVRLFKDARWHVIAWHADKSFTQHATLLEAHDALVESGSPSPFEVVKGAAVETPHEPTPDAKTWEASGMGPGHDAGP